MALPTETNEKTQRIEIRIRIEFLDYLKKHKIESKLFVGRVGGDMYAFFACWAWGARGRTHLNVPVFERSQAPKTTLALCPAFRGCGSAKLNGIVTQPHLSEMLM